jgi:hypothetical protein
MQEMKEVEDTETLAILQTLKEKSETDDLN